MARLKNNIFLFVALMITILLTPLESVSIGGEDSSFSVVKLSVLFVFGIWAINGFRFRLCQPVKSFIVLFLFFVLTLALSIDTVHSANRLFLMLLPTILLCVIIDYNTNTRVKLVWILVAYFIGALILSGYAYFNRAEILMNAVNEYGERVSALGHDENEMSYLLVLGVTCGLHLMRLSKNTLVKILIVFSVVVFSFFTISTASRTGMIILFLVFVIYFLGSMKTRKGRIGVIVLSVALFAASSYFIAFTPESTISRLFETRELVASGDMSGRKGIWTTALDAFLDGNMITGAGYGNFINRYAEYTKEVGRASHNTYLGFLVCGGLIGFILFVYILVEIWKECKKVYRLSGDLFVFAYYIPLLVTMLTLETAERRWLYIIGVLIYKWGELLEQEKLNQIIERNDQIENRTAALSRRR